MCFVNGDTFPPCCIPPAPAVLSDVAWNARFVPVLYIDHAAGFPAPDARQCHSPATAAAVGKKFLFQSTRLKFQFVTFVMKSSIEEKGIL